MICPVASKASSNVRSLTRLAMLFAICVLFACCAAAQSLASRPTSKLRFEISFPESLSSQPLDGHILLGISSDPSTEPRFQLREEEAFSAQFFGLDVDGWKPGATAIIDSTALGYPLVRLDQLLPGD